MASRSLAATAADEEVDVACNPSLADRADRVDKLLEDRCRRADVGIIEAPVPG